MSVAVTIIISILGSSAVFGFLEFIIQRRDHRSELFAAIDKKIDKIFNRIDELSEKVDDNDKKMLDAVELSAVKTARVRILQASDEIRRTVMHSEEYFDQLHEDITLYQNYCRTHPEFQNNKAVHAIENINTAYQRCLHDDMFL